MAESGASLKQQLLPSVPAEVMGMYRDLLASPEQLSPIPSPGFPSVVPDLV